MRTTERQCGGYPGRKMTPDNRMYRGPFVGILIHIILVTARLLETAQIHLQKAILMQDGEAFARRTASGYFWPVCISTAVLDNALVTIFRAALQFGPFPYFHPILEFLSDLHLDLLLCQYRNVLVKVRLSLF